MMEHSVDQHLQMTGCTKLSFRMPLRQTTRTIRGRPYHYEDTRFPYALTGITDENGNRFATWTYDQYFRATLSKHGTGDADKVTIAYDDVNNITTITNALTKDTKYHFGTITGVSKLIQVEGVASTHCVATNSTYAYDTNGFVNQIVDREGNKTTYVNNSRGLPTSLTEAKDDLDDERTITRTWHASLRKPTQIVRPGLTTDYTYDAKGNVLTRTETDTTSHTVPYSTNGQTRVWTYTYTYNGTTPSLLEKLEIDGPRSGTGDKTTYDYDTNGYLTKVTNALGHITDITSVDGMGRPTSVTDPNGIVTDLAYDERGRLLSRTVDPGPDEAVTRFTYNSAGLVTRVRLPDNSELTYAYDDAKRLTQVTNTAGEKIVYTLNDLGNVTKEEVKSETGAIKHTLTREFDELGRLMKSVGASLQEATYTYDKNDLLKTVTDPKSNATTRAYDALNRLAKITDAATNDALYNRDGADNLTGVTDQRSLQTTYVHNGFGDVIRRVSPDTGTTDYVYDSAGNLTQMTDARAIVTNYAYDDLNRRTSKTFPANTSENVTYTYDDVTTGNKGKGRLTKIEDSSGSTEFVYDARGNVVTETRTIGATVYSTFYAYDFADNLTEITYPSGRKVTYLRDALGRVNSVMTKKNGAAADVVIASNITYLPFGPIGSLRYGNGQVATFTYDQDYRVTDIVTTDGTTNVQDLDYGYDAASNITSITDNLATSLNQTLDYDALHRLTDATGVYGDIDYSYDAVGNRTSKTIDLGTPDTLTYATTSNQLLTVSDGVVTRSMTYTANGHLATDSRDGGLAFNYSHDNRLTQVTDQATPTPATIADYVYNDLGQRVVKDIGGANVTHYHYDRAGAVIAESESDGTLLREYIRLIGLPLAVIDAAAATTPSEVTVDNDDTAATSTGTWTTKTALSGYLGADYASAEDGDGTGDFTWTPAVPSNGPYQVYARWPEDATTGSSATYTIHHAGGSTDVTVDQKKDGAAWQLLGTFIMNTAVGHKVVLSDKADPPAGPEEVVVDNQATGVTVTGSWASGTALTGYHGFDYLSIASGVGAGEVSWGLPVSSAGRYKVFARWTQASTHVQYARYAVHHDGGTSTVSVDQRGGAGSWNLLGSFELDPLNDPKVVLSGEITQGAAGTVVADAVRVVRDDANAIELIRDNDQDTRWGIWSHNYGTNTCCTGFLGNNYRREGTNPGSGAWFQWQLHTVIANTGWYKVYTRWPYGRTDDASEIRYAIAHKNGAVTRTVNQRTNGGEWNLLGVYEFAPGPDRFNRNITTFAKANAGQVAMADAVRLVPVDGPEVNEIIVDNTPSPGNSTGLNFTRLDNGVAGAASVGPWLTSNWTGGGPFWGSNFAYIDTTGSDSFTWTPTLPETGAYDVYVRWSQASDRASQATYAVHHSGGSTQVIKDQRSGGGVLQHLGQFDMVPGQNHRVVLTAPSGRLAADEIVFILSPGSAAVTGTWTSDSGEDNGIHWGTDFLKIAPGTGSNDFTWTPEVPSSGAYKVYARWTSGSDRTSEATYTIHHAGGSTAVTVNQRGSGGSWNLLGTFTLTPGSNHRVVLADDAPDGSWVIADAIKFEKVPPVPRQVAADAIKLVKNDAELVKYVHTDHLGSPQKMTDTTGAIVWDAAFTPFGLEDSITGTAANNKRFPGQYFDPETGLHYNYLRDYDPTVGRYVQSDPLGLSAGDLNLYRYVENAPLTFIDPFGLTGIRANRGPTPRRSTQDLVNSTVRDALVRRLRKINPNARFETVSKPGSAPTLREIRNLERLISREITSQMRRSDPENLCLITQGGRGDITNIPHHVQRAIERIARRYDVEITLVGSRAGGRSNPNDFDYIAGGNYRLRKRLESELPRGERGGKIGNYGQESGIEVFNRAKPPNGILNPNKPYINFTPKK